MEVFSFVTWRYKEIPDEIYTDVYLLTGPSTLDLFSAFKNFKHLIGVLYGRDKVVRDNVEMNTHYFIQKSTYHKYRCKRHGLIYGLNLDVLCRFSIPKWALKERLKRMNTCFTGDLIGPNDYFWFEESLSSEKRVFWLFSKKIRGPVYASERLTSDHLHLLRERAQPVTDSIMDAYRVFNEDALEIVLWSEKSLEKLKCLREAER